MSFFQNFLQFLILDHLDPLTRGFTELFTTSCDSSEPGKCRDDSAALILKFVAMASILLAGAAGVSLPLIGTLSHRRRLFPSDDGSVFMVAKAFAAGVILATGFVHMLSGGSAALSDPCLPEYPWTKFPFPGFFAMVAALLTLLADFLMTRYYEGKRENMILNSTESMSRVALDSGGGVGSGHLESGFLGEEESSGGLPIVGMRAENRRHGLSIDADGFRALSKSSDGAGEGHIHGHGDAGLDSRVRHVVVSQILELGIVSHSIIIGLSLGVSSSPCTIRPLIAALSFHQFFEGFALGGCISEAELSPKASTAMACFFAVTAPLGVAVGTAVATQYNAYSVAALVVEGVLDSLSAGILVYMALVDLIAADFLSKRMSLNFRLQLVSYFFLFLGAASMSLLAVWA